MTPQVLDNTKSTPDLTPPKEQSDGPQQLLNQNHPKSQARQPQDLDHMSQNNMNQYTSIKRARCLLLKCRDLDQSDNQKLNKQKIDSEALDLSQQLLSKQECIHKDQFLRIYQVMMNLMLPQDQGTIKPLKLFRPLYLRKSLKSISSLDRLLRDSQTNKHHRRLGLDRMLK